MEEKKQEELAKEWEEALKAQEAQESEAETPPQEEEKREEEDVMAAWQEALAQQEGSGEGEGGKTSPEMNDDSQIKEGKCGEKMELLKDIPLEITVEVGSTRLPLEEILNLHANSVVELERLVDEPLDIKINGKLVAKGKLYVVKDSYGIEITQIITPEERLKLIEE